MLEASLANTKFRLNTVLSKQTDRQTDILLTEKNYRLICHRNERDICTCIYKIVSLLKSL